AWGRWESRRTGGSRNQVPDPPLPAPEASEHVGGLGVSCGGAPPGGTQENGGPPHGAAGRPVGGGGVLAGGGQMWLRGAVEAGGGVGVELRRVAAGEHAVERVPAIRVRGDAVRGIGVVAGRGEDLLAGRREVGADARAGVAPLVRLRAGIAEVRVRDLVEKRQ